MQITYQLTADDYRDGMFAWRNLSPWRRWAVRICLAVATLAIGVCVLSSFIAPKAVGTWAPLGVLSMFWVLFLLFGHRFSAKRQFRNLPSAQHPMTVDVSDFGLRVRSVQADSSMAWSGYMAWGEGKSVFVILPQPRIYVPIPKRAFTAEHQDEFRELLRKNIKAAK
jgi:YcxB-like protein